MKIGQKAKEKSEKENLENNNNVEKEEVEQEIVDEIPEKEEESEIEKLKKEISAGIDRYQRTMAEFDNFRKRTQKEKAAMYDDGAFDLALGLLPVIDNFERAFQSASDSDKKLPFYTGIEAIHKQLMTYLLSKDIEAINAKGEQFDPNLHEAIAHIDDDSYGTNEVIDELQRGYMFKDKVLRHSMVRVAN